MAKSNTDGFFDNNKLYASGQQVHKPAYPGKQPIQPSKRVAVVACYDVDSGKLEEVSYSGPTGSIGREGVNPATARSRVCAARCTFLYRSAARRDIGPARDEIFTPSDARGARRAHESCRRERRYATLPKLKSVAPAGAFSPASRQPCAIGPPGNSVYR